MISLSVGAFEGRPAVQDNIAMQSVEAMMQATILAAAQAER
jgi:hypothetical protein